MVVESMAVNRIFTRGRSRLKLYTGPGGDSQIAAAISRRYYYKGSSRVHGVLKKDVTNFTEKGRRRFKCKIVVRENPACSLTLLSVEVLGLCHWVKVIKNQGPLHHTDSLTIFLQIQLPI